MLNSMMRASLAQAERQAHARAEQQRKEAAEKAAAEQRRQAEIAAQEVRRREEEIRLAKEKVEADRVALEDKQRIDTLIANAKREANGEMGGIANMQTVYNEAQETIDKFAATNPLEAALLANKLEAVQFLFEKGLRYDEWQDLVDEGSPIHSYLSNQTKPSNRPGF